MTSFSWKKKSINLKPKATFKSSEHLSTCEKAFAVDVEEKDNELSVIESRTNGSSHYDWCVALKKRKLAEGSETSSEKIKRLKEEGISLVENEDYWQAIGRWDQVLEIIGKDLSVIPDETKAFHEMKAQVLIQLHEWEPAIEAAQKAVALDPKWYSGYQTLGRAQLGIGNVSYAVIAFSKARHLNPADEEIKVQDLEWAASLLTHQKLMIAAKELNQT